MKRATPCRLACIALVVLSSRAARGDEAPERQVTPTAMIPPGQEELLTEMLALGAALPAGCAFVTGQIDRAVVRAEYSCAGREAVVELRHPSAAPRAAVQTEKIAIVTVRGTVPATLIAVLQERIRERESSFEWVWPIPMEAVRREAVTKEVAPKPSSLEVCASPPGPSGTISPHVPDCYPRFAAVLVGIAQTMVIALGLGCGLVRLYRTSDG